MVLGEMPGANRHNAERRVFKLGGDQVKERLLYDVSGVDGRL